MQASLDLIDKEEMLVGTQDLYIRMQEICLNSLAHRNSKKTETANIYWDPFLMGLFISLHTYCFY